MTTGERTAHRPSRLFSTLSLVAGVLGAAISWVGWGFLLPILAIIFGVVAARREKRFKLLWIIGLVLGILGLIVSIVSLFLQYLTIMAAIGYDAG